jgi:hypothetical protein
MNRYAPLTINVRVYQLSDGEEVQSHTIDYNETKNRIWLQRLCVWAWNNHHSVVMDNILDAQLVIALDNAFNAD